MPLKSLTEYEAEPALTEPPNLSGLSCPDCTKELAWDNTSLICKEPPMRRLNCECGFSKVVEFKG